MEPRIARLADRTCGIMEVVNNLITSWSYDLSTRKPGIAYLTPDGHPVTNLDLACYLSSLVSYRAVINLPRYVRARAKTTTEGEMTVSKDNRHGRTIELRSHQKVWSFGVSIEDVNVITADDVGKPRTYMLQGIDGDWHDGWSTIEIIPKRGLAQEVFDALCGKDNKMRFDYFIHPLRWTSIFGEDFRNAKFAADYRISDELRFVKSEIKRLREELEIAPKEWPKSETGPSQPKKVWGYESFIDGVTLTGEYEPFPTTKEGFDEALSRKRRLEQVQKTLRFHVRASEFAWWRYFTKEMPLRDSDGELSREPIDWVNNGGVEISKPVWAKNREWRHGVTDPAKPKGRTLFTSMEMEPGVSYRFRVMHRTERVAP